MRIIWAPTVVCALCGPAAAQVAPPAVPPDAPADPATPSDPERVRHVADTVEQLAELAALVGLDTASREGARLAAAAHVAADYAEVALLVARANQPTALTTYGAVTAGVGARDLRDRGFAGELALTAGIAISGPACTLLDVHGRLSLATEDGLALAQAATVCLGAIGLEDASIPGEHAATALAINAHQRAGLNVRPSVDAAAVTDRGRFTLAEAGLSIEGIRYFWRHRRWSVAAPMVAVSQSVLTHKVDGDRETLLRLTASVWFAELRYHRDRGRLTDFMMRLFPIAVDKVEAGDALSTISLFPLELRGLGTHGVYVDAAGGLDATAEDPEDTPEMIAARPDIGVGSWRLALNLGVPRVNAALVWRQHLAPTLRESVVIERRASAIVNVDLPAVFLTAEAYRAELRWFEGPGDTIDARYRTWGVHGEGWFRAGDHLLVGATFEVGRAFVFADPSPTLGEPPFGYVALAQLGWRGGTTRALD